MKIRVKMVLWLVFAMVCICSVSISNLIFDWPKLPVLDSTSAAWVQAIGSILAIGIAIWVPYSQRELEVKKQVIAKQELELSRTEQLLSICNELHHIVSVLPSEHAGADYNLTNEMSRKLFESLVDRLNSLQREELNGVRLGLCLKLRMEIYDWLKFFSEVQEHDGAALYFKSERELPRIDEVRQMIENVIRGLAGLPALAIVKPQAAQQDDVPWL